ncbi:MAG TPA: CHASE4 domain-containing protein [Woeseiaceae bacterium]|nr:CHASE4 domain-containing protein [Woeseiaceae bacterium]
MALLILLSYVILNATVAPAFTSMEFAAAETNLVRAQRAIRNDLDNLAAIVGDWASWDDAYAYVRGEYPAFEKSNLDRPTLENLDLDLMLIYDVAGALLWGQVMHDGEFADPTLLEVFEPAHPLSGKLIRHNELTSRTEGLLQTALGPMMLSSRPILKSGNAGPIAGTMIMGRFFDTSRLAELQERTEVNLDWHVLDEMTPPNKELRDAVIAAGPDKTRHRINGEAVESYTLLTDLFGKPFLALQVDTPRHISALGGRAVNVALLFFLVAGVVVAVAAWLLLRTVIVVPLMRLDNHISGIRRSGDLSLRLNERRNDEIGVLAKAFDMMTIDLHAARQLLLEQSFKAGKADTAAEVLHNIRNAMTPLINGIDRLSKNFRFAGNLRVVQAVGELSAPDCPPDRRDKLKKYIESAFGHVCESSESAVQELAVASKQARQVEAILMDQEKITNVAPVVENLELGEIIEEATLVIPDRNNTDIRLNLQDGLRRFRVRAHRVGLLQVIGNLILNSHEAIRRQQPGSGSIDVAASEEMVDERPMIRISIKDSGCGFESEQSNKIFQRGFSSKKGHLSGLGLHWSANALAGMGGRIIAESPGPGRGAQFSVLLPAA